MELIRPWIIASIAFGIGGVIGGIVTGINLVLLILVIWRRRRLGKATFAPRWSAMDIWFVAQITLVLVVALLIPLTVFAFLAGVSLDDMMHMSSNKVIVDLLLPSAIIQNIPFFLVPAAWINLKYKMPLRAIGLTRWPRGRDWTAGILLGLLGMALSGLVSAGVEALANQFHSVPWVQAATAIDKNNPIASMENALPHIGAIGVLLAVLGVGVAAPFGEEMLFRGFAFNALKRRFGVGVGIVLSALLFTLPHSYGLGLIPVFVLGALMAWAYNNSGSLWVTIILHATNNTIQVLLACFPSSGHR